MHMLEDRNLLAHSYDEKLAEEALRKIKENYYSSLKQVFEKLNSLL